MHGKLNFYLSAVDDILKSKEDNPSIGILLCKEKNKVKAEYALKDINKPIGISEYEKEEDNANLICAKAADELLTISDITVSFVLRKSKKSSIYKW